MRLDVPSEIKRIVCRALEKRPQARYSSAGEMLRDLQRYQESLRIPETGLLSLRSLLRLIRKPRVSVPALLILLAIGSLGFWFFNRQSKIRWAREELLPKIDQLVEAGWQSYVTAYKLAVDGEKLLPRDPKLTELLKEMAVTISVKTEPPGARIISRIPLRSCRRSLKPVRH